MNPYRVAEKSVKIIGLALYWLIIGSFLLAFFVFLPAVFLRSGEPWYVALAPYGAVVGFGVLGFIIAVIAWGFSLAAPWWRRKKAAWDERGKQWPSGK